jgi:hypothetical protein
MAVTTTVAVKNALLDAIATAWGATPQLRLYSGTMPTTVNDALSGNTMLAEVTPAPAAASAGSKDMLGGAKTTTGAAAGTATFYRVYNSAGSTAHEQGTVTATGGGGDMTVDNTSIAVGQTVNFNTFTKTQP